jgi:hypothetical protein
VVFLLAIAVVKVLCDNHGFEVLQSDNCRQI